MHGYKPATPRALFAFAAVALAGATFALAVVVPSTMEWGMQEIGVLTQNDAMPSRTALDDVTATIDVVAVRGTRLVPVWHSPARQAKAGMQG